jgi:hypothetical protein
MPALLISRSTRSCRAADFLGGVFDRGEILKAGVDDLRGDRCGGGCCFGGTGSAATVASY